MKLPTKLMFVSLPHQVVVLWVGTNNHGHTAEQICGGIMAIVQLIKDEPTCRGHTDKYL